METICQLEQIIREDVWPKPIQYLRNNFRKLTNSFGKIDFRGIGEFQGVTAWAAVGLRCDGWEAVTRFPCFTKNRANSDIRILQIRRGVSVQRKHLVPRKNVICRPIL